MNGPPPSGISDSPCDRAPVHIPGTIQSHGILLALPAADRTARGPLLAASADAAGSAPARLDDVLDPASVDRVADALARPDPEAGEVLEGIRSHDGRRWTGLLRRGLAATLVELEPELPADPAATRRILLELNRAIEALARQPDIAAACRVACAQMRRITGFDQVMVYRFMPDWSGEVVAEALDPDAAGHSYLGLVFPASDIPAPARALYASNRLRLIPDAAAAPVPLHAPADAPGGGAAPLDLSQAVLRGVAPVHLQYLANMGVAASMSVAIMTPDRSGDADRHFWGLFACHHLGGRLFVDHVRRQAAETVAQALSWRLAGLAEAEASRRTTRMQEELAPFLAAATGDEAGGPDPAPAVLPDALPDAGALLAACGAGGIAVLGDGTAGLAGHPLRAGALPPEPALAGLAGWLDRTQGPGPFVTDRLCSLLPAPLAARLGTGLASGLLAVPLSEAPDGAAGGWVLWFRPELRRQVSWAGHKPENPDPARPLSPRASFAAWHEEVAGRSAAWPDWSLAAARQFRDGLVAALARRSARMARSNAELHHRNEEIRFFADAATHDLKEPLWQVQVLCGLVRDGLAELFGPTEDGQASSSPDPARAALAREAADLELETMAGMIVTSANRMRAMIDDLARFAIAGRDPDRLYAVPLLQVAQEALDDLGEALRAVPDATVEVRELAGVVLHADPLQLRRLFQNLFSNAVKYRDPARPLVLRAAARRAGQAVHVEVADNGTGFDAADRQALFEPFRRFHQPGDDAPDGLGLGLAICQRIVAAHGGTIEAQPLAPGARFSFVLLDAGPAPPAPDPVGRPNGDAW